MITNVYSNPSNKVNLRYKQNECSRCTLRKKRIFNCLDSFFPNFLENTNLLTALKLQPESDYSLINIFDISERANECETWNRNVSKQCSKKLNISATSPIKIAFCLRVFPIHQKELAPYPKNFIPNLFLNTMIFLHNLEA